MIFGSLQDVYQSCSDLCCRHLHQRMPLLGRSIRLRQGLKIIKSNVIDAITLLLGAIFFPEEVLLSMAGNLHWGLHGNKVPRDVLPISATVHM